MVQFAQMNALIKLPDYEIIRSRRKTLAIEVRPGTKVLVRAPLNISKAEIERFVYARKDWINKHFNRAPIKTIEYFKDEQAYLKEKARQVLPPLIERFGKLLKVSPATVRITSAKTRFGSCSSKKTLAFSYRLMAYPMEAIEYVVLHELAHLVHMNHSKDFYGLIELHMPDYKMRAKLLKQEVPA